MSDITDRKLTIEFSDELFEKCNITEEGLDKAVRELEQSYPVVAWWDTNGTNWGETYSIHTIRQQMSDEDIIKEALQRTQHRLIENDD